MSEFTDMIAEITKVAEKHNSHAYRFFFQDAFPEFSEFDSELVEIRCWPGNRRHELTPCDRAGRPIDQPKPDYPDDQAFIQVGGGVSQPTPTIREEIREEEVEKVRGEQPDLFEPGLKPEPKPKKKWWK